MVRPSESGHPASVRARLRSAAALVALLLAFAAWMLGGCSAILGFDRGVLATGAETGAETGPSDSGPSCVGALLEVSPAALDYGEVLIDAGQSLEVVVTNRGRETILTAKTDAPAFA